LKQYKFWQGHLSYWFYGETGAPLGSKTTETALRNKAVSELLLPLLADEHANSKAEVLNGDTLFNITTQTKGSDVSTVNPRSLPVIAP